MSRFEGVERVGLRDLETEKLIAIYPNRISGTDNDIEDKVKYWFYQQDCSAEETLRHSYIDALTDEELKSVKSYKFGEEG